MNIVLTRKLPLDAQALLADTFDSIKVWPKKTAPKPKELLSFAKAADVIVCTLEDTFNAKTIQALPNLKHLITYSVGVNHIDRMALKARGIRLSYTPGALTDATADLTWALILSATRRIVESVNYVRQGKFKGYEPNLFLGTELRGKTLGIVGMGRIGKAVAERASGFGMKVMHAGRSKKDLKVVLKKADILSLHCPLTDVTRHLIGAQVLKQMKPTAVLVNTSRGPVVDEKALVKHLKQNPQFTAALDVYEFEPRLTPGLLKLSNALCVPHIGSATREARTAMARICLEEAVGFAKGLELRYVYPS